MNWIAQQFVTFVAPDGRQWSGRVAIAAPEQDTPTSWGCRLVADGVVEIPGPIFGASPLQATVLALRFLAGQLFVFVENGGRVLEPRDQSDARLDLTFGPLWARP